MNISRANFNYVFVLFFVLSNVKVAFLNKWSHFSESLLFKLRQKGWAYLFSKDLFQQKVTVKKITVYLFWFFFLGETSLQVHINKHKEACNWRCILNLHVFGLVGTPKFNGGFTFLRLLESKVCIIIFENRLITPWTQDIKWTYIERSKVVSRKSLERLVH